MAKKPTTRDALLEMKKQVENAQKAFREVTAAMQGVHKANAELLEAIKEANKNVESGKPKDGGKRG